MSKPSIFDRVPRFARPSPYEMHGLTHIIENGVMYNYFKNIFEQFWYKYGTKILHREGDLPAYQNDTGLQEWWIEGKLHREGSPAQIRPNGTRKWYRQGQLHREDGPAVILANGDQHWWYQGEWLEITTQAEFERWLRLKAFL